MRRKYSFREPLMMSEEGLYITASQVQFFTNRRNGQKQFESCDNEFLNYYKQCCLYNVVYDMMEIDEECASMYWDSETKSIALSFPMKGLVADTLAEVSFSFSDDLLEDGIDDDEDENPFDLF